MMALKMLITFRNQMIDLYINCERNNLIVWVTYLPVKIIIERISKNHIKCKLFYKS